MGSTVPRHSWEATGLVTTGPLGAVLIWSRCRWCSQVDTCERRRRLAPCTGAPRPARELQPGWWRRALAAHGVALPPEPRPEFAAPRLVAAPWIDSDGGRVHPAAGDVVA